MLAILRIRTIFADPGPFLQFDMDPALLYKVCMFSQILPMLMSFALVYLTSKEEFARSFKKFRVLSY
jgi:hypothetical protein